MLPPNTNSSQPLCTLFTDTNKLFVQKWPQFPYLSSERLRIHSVCFGHLSYTDLSVHPCKCKPLLNQRWREKWEMCHHSDTLLHSVIHPKTCGQLLSTLLSRDVKKVRAIASRHKDKLVLITYCPPIRTMSQGSGWWTRNIKGSSSAMISKYSTTAWGFSAVMESTSGCWIWLACILEATSTMQNLSMLLRTTANTDHKNLVCESQMVILSLLKLALRCDPMVVFLSVFTDKSSSTNSWLQKLTTSGQTCLRLA